VRCGEFTESEHGFVFEEDSQVDFWLADSSGFLENAFIQTIQSQWRRVLAQSAS